MVDYDEVQKVDRILKQMNIIPGIDLTTGEPIFISDLTTMGVGAITTERLLQDLEKKDLELDLSTMTFQKKAKKEAPPTPKETPAPKKEPTSKKASLWAKKELEMLTRAELREIAKQFEDVHGNKKSEVIIAQLTGKPKQ